MIGLSRLAGLALAVWLLSACEQEGRSVDDASPGEGRNAVAEPDANSTRAASCREAVLADIRESEAFPLRLYQDDQPYLSVVARWPDSGQQSVNQASDDIVARWVCRVRDDYPLSELESPALRELGLVDEEGDATGRQLNLQIQTDRVDGDQLHSLLFRIDLGGLPGVSGHWRETLTFNEQGRRLELADLFRPDSNFLPRLSALARQELGARAGDLVSAADLLPVSDNFRRFLVTEQQLIVLFDRAVDADSTELPLVLPQVAIPLSLLEAQLNPRYFRIGALTAGELQLGLVQINEAATTFTPCGSNETFWVMDRSGDLERLYDELDADGEGVVLMAVYALILGPEETVPDAAANFDGVMEITRVEGAAPRDACMAPEPFEESS